MAFIRGINLKGEHKKESTISKILNEEKGRCIEKVELNGETLTISFSYTKRYRIKNVVKQYSKERYNEGVGQAISDFLENNKILKACFGYHTPYSVIEVIELQDVWLVFFERNR